MKKNIWQTDQQIERSGIGKKTIARVNQYIKIWEKRCYKDGIPENVPYRLMKAKKAPSYKAIALCILNNDFMLKNLGFSESESLIADSFRAIKNQAESEKESGQKRLFI